MVWRQNNDWIIENLVYSMTRDSGNKVQLKAYKQEHLVNKIWSGSFENIKPEKYFKTLKLNFDPPRLLKYIIVYLLNPNYIPHPTQNNVYAIYVDQPYILNKTLDGKQVIDGSANEKVWALVADVSKYLIELIQQ